DRRNAAGDRLAPPAARDVQHRERAPQPGLRRLVHEAVLAQRADALLDDGVADLDALTGVDFPKPLLQSLLAVLGAELALDELLAVTERIDDVHREHHFVERCSLPGILPRRRAGRHRFGHATVAVIVRGGSVREAACRDPLGSADPVAAVSRRASIIRRPAPRPRAPGPR